MRQEIDTVCPICGQPGTKAELDRLAIEWYENWFDAQENLRVFGTPIPKVDCAYSSIVIRAFACRRISCVSFISGLSTTSRLASDLLNVCQPIRLLMT
jgi:hypothetical protein